MRVSTSFLVLVCSVLSLLSNTPAQYMPANGGNVDEGLFLLYLLKQECDVVPSVEAPEQQQLQWVNDTAKLASQARAIVQQDRLDAALDAMFQDILDFTGMYQNFLATRRSLETQQSRQTVLDFFATVQRTLDSSSKAQSLAGGLGASEEGAKRFGSTVGVGAGVIDALNRGQQRDSNTAAALQGETGRLVSAWQTLIGRQKGVVMAIAPRHGWPLAETGYDGYHNADRAASVQRMPRNPFAVLNAVVNLSGTESARDLSARSKASLQAADLVPARPQFHLIRSVFLLEATMMAVDAAAVEAGLNGYTGGVTPLGGYAEYQARKFLTEDSADAGAQGYLLLARGLALTGRFQEAVQNDETGFRMDPQLQGNPVNTFRHAQMVSLLGDQNSALQWLAVAYRAGFNQIPTVRKLGSFYKLRAQRPEEFKRMTTAVLTNPKPYWGFVNDDFEVTNQSPFDLSNVLVSVVVHQRGVTYPFKMRCPLIKSMAACRVNDVVSILGSAMDGMEATFSADQTAP